MNNVVLAPRLLNFGRGWNVTICFTPRPI